MIFDRSTRFKVGLRAGLRATITTATLLANGAAIVHAQSTVSVPDVRGDQLIFFYDARTGRVPFLSVSNPSSSAINVEVAFYNTSLDTRLGQEVCAIGAAGNVVIDPTSSSTPCSAGGAANGNAGLAVVTPVAGPQSTQPVVPPAPLTGNFTLANTTLGSAFGENALGRLAVNGDGTHAAAGQNVDGSTIAYQRFTPTVLTVPVYFNPTTLGAPENDGNRVILAEFNDQYGARFDVTPASDSPMATFFDRQGMQLAMHGLSVSGVLLSSLQDASGGASFSSSGKAFFSVNPGGGNAFGIFSQSQGTFASGQRMPAVDAVPTGSTGGGQTVTVMVGSGGFTFTPDPVMIHVGDTVHWVWASGGHSVTSGTNGTADNNFCSPNDTNCSSGSLNNTGFTYDHTFTAAGSFPYFCVAHVFMGMVGTVQVMQ